MTIRQLVAVLGVLGAAVVVRCSCAPAGESQDMDSPGDTRQSEAMAQLEATLAQVKCAWNPRVKDRIVVAARRDVARLERPLLSILSDPDHGYLEQAIYLASELRLVDVRPSIVDLASTAPEIVRPAAIVAAGRIEAWSTEELAEFLGSDTPAIRAAAAELVGVGEFSVEMLIAMLENEEPAVRDAALVGIPPVVPDAARQRILEWASHARDGTEVWAIRALGKMKLCERSESFLDNKLGSADRATRAAALDALTHKKGRLVRPSTVWSLAIDSAFREDPFEQARALLCLEQTRSFAVGEVLGQEMRFRHPLPRLFAARCLITGGHKQGAEMLVELLSSGLEDLGDGFDIDAIRREICSILEKLSGLSQQAGHEGLSRWIHGVRELGSRRLTVPTELW